MSTRPDRAKRQTQSRSTPQPTTSFDPIYPQEARERADREEITGAAEEKREGRQKSSGGRDPSSSRK
jgi:hypothetical protein